jgi:hypothetical protein
MMLFCPWERDVQKLVCCFCLCQFAVFGNLGGGIHNGGGSHKVIVLETHNNVAHTVRTTMGRPTQKCSMGGSH